MADLGKWLAGRAAMRRQAGVQDCCTLPGDWAIAAGWPDPMAEWRADYASDEEGHARIADAGSLLALFERGFASAGIARRSGKIELGDVGLVEIGGLEAGAIFAGKRWAIVAQRGIGMVSLDPDYIAAVWAVGRG